MYFVGQSRLTCMMKRITRILDAIHRTELFILMHPQYIYMKKNWQQVIQIESRDLYTHTDFISL